MSSMSAAKHKFHSQAKPGGRLVFTVDAFIAFAQDLQVSRSRDAIATDCRTFLEELCNEAYMQVSMMIGFADQVLILNRYVDTEDIGITEMTFEVSRFCNQMLLLFRDGRCMDTAGFTQADYGVHKIDPDKKLQESCCLGGAGLPTYRQRKGKKCN